MRDIFAVLILGLILGFTIGIWSSLLIPAEWHSSVWKNAYYPFTVETSVRDK